MKVFIANSRHRSCLGKNERGYILLTLLFFLTLMIIAMAAAVPYAKVAIKRDKEAELIHRGTQYARAIGRYYKRFGRYPASLEQLENTNNMRFLRKRYKDPMTGKDDWTIIHVGEGQSRTSGLNGPGTSNPLQGVGTPAVSLSSQSTSAGSTGQTDTSNAVGTAGTRGNPGGLSSPRFGGGAVMGVASSKEEESIKELNGKDHYNDWQFVYDPTQDPSMRGRTAMPNQQGLPGATPGQPGPTGPGVSPQGGPTSPPGTMGGPGPTPTPR